MATIMEFLWIHQDATISLTPAYNSFILSQYMISPFWKAEKRKEAREWRGGRNAGTLAENYHQY